MKKILIYSMLIFSCANYAIAPDVLPGNAKNKIETVQLELKIKEVQSFIDANKPVAAATYLPYAKEELKRIRIHLLDKDILEFERRLENMENTINIQKAFQMKKYGKLLEVN